MPRRTALVVTLTLVMSAAAASQQAPQTQQDPLRPLPALETRRAMPAERHAGGYVLERDKDVAREEPGPHKGGGPTVAYSFFRDTPNLAMVFRKRALKPGAAIGYHEQHEDEIYYVLSGRGVMTIDGKAFDVGAGDAILTRPGSSHGLKQMGREDLVIVINYLQAKSLIPNR